MSDPTYQVVGECAHATVSTPYGRSVQLLLKGALVPADAPQLKHLLSTGLVARVGGDGPVDTGLNADGGLGPAQPVHAPPPVDTEPAAEPEPSVTVVGDPGDAAMWQRRADAAAKLPTDGSPPRANATHEVWVEYAVRQGMGRAEAEKATKDDLRKALGR